MTNTPRAMALEKTRATHIALLTISAPESQRELVTNTHMFDEVPRCWGVSHHWTPIRLTASQYFARRALFPSSIIGSHLTPVPSVVTFEFCHHSEPQSSEVFALLPAPQLQGSSQTARILSPSTPSPSHVAIAAASTQRRATAPILHFFLIPNPNP